MFRPLWAILRSQKHKEDYVELVAIQNNVLVPMFVHYI
jgi:hypothetical protein